MNIKILPVWQPNHEPSYFETEEWCFRPRIEITGKEGTKTGNKSRLSVEERKHLGLDQPITILGVCSTPWLGFITSLSDLPITSSHLFRKTPSGSFSTRGFTLKTILGLSSILYCGHTGRSEWLGSPLRAKLIHAF